MLQVAFIRENKEIVLKGLAKRNFKNAEELVEKTIAADEDTQSNSNRIGCYVWQNLINYQKILENYLNLVKRQKADILKQKTVQLKDKSKDLTESLQNKANELQELLYLIPNIPNEIVPAWCLQQMII